MGVRRVVLRSSWASHLDAARRGRARSTIFTRSPTQHPAEPIAAPASHWPEVGAGGAEDARQRGWAGAAEVAVGAAGEHVRGALDEAASTSRPDRSVQRWKVAMNL